jgi:hypothetical protein
MHDEILSHRATMFVCENIRDIRVMEISNLCTLRKYFNDIELLNFSCSMPMQLQLISQCAICYLFVCFKTFRDFFSFFPPTDCLWNIFLKCGSKGTSKIFQMNDRQKNSLILSGVCLKIIFFLTQKKKNQNQLQSTFLNENFFRLDYFMASAASTAADEKLE